MRDNIVEYAITTADANGALIGHNSQTLAALQYVTSLIVNQYFDRDTESGLIVKVDIGDYRKNRDEKLEKMAVRIAREVSKTYYNLSTLCDIPTIITKRILNFYSILVSF